MNLSFSKEKIFSYRSSADLKYFFRILLHGHGKQSQRRHDKPVAFTPFLDIIDHRRRFFTRHVQNLTPK